MIPKISVVMAVFNAEEFLKEAIESILGQTFTDFEFIIVNDGSTDSSLEIIQSYNDERIMIINQKNQGLAKSLNNGIKVSNGEFIGRMDADDISYLDRFEKQINYLNVNNECIIVGGNANYIDYKGNFLFRSILPLIDKDIKNALPESPFFHSSILFSKKAFFEAGQYPEEIFQYFEDKILWNKMAKLGEFSNLQDVLIQYRMVPNSISNLPHDRLLKVRIIANGIIKNNYFFSPSDVQKIKELVNVSKSEKYANYYLRLGAIYLSQNKRWLAFKNLILSFYYQPFEINTTTRLIACLFPHHFYQALKNRKLSKK